MESMQNAKQNSSANIGEGGGSLLVGILVKNNMCCIFSGVNKYIFFIGVLPTRGPPSKMHTVLCGFAKRIYVFAERGAQQVLVFHRDPNQHGTLPPDGVSRCYSSLSFGHM